MFRKKIDNRIRILIENCVSTHHRSIFVIVGEKSRNNVSILHEMLSKAEVKARPTVLWCYKKDLGFSTNRKKRQRQKKARMMHGRQQPDDDPLEYFVSATSVRYCYYSETDSILGQTFGMAVLQDFEALTPNLLARTIETVQGGGIVLILLQTLTSLKELYTMTMDVHAHYKTEAHQDIVCRFNKRLILSLQSCGNCLILDDQLNILPIYSNASSIKPVPPQSLNDAKSAEDEEFEMLKSNLGNTPTDVLIKLCKTFDQAKAVKKFIDSLSEKTLRSTVTLTSARGRGKSAALGLAIAAAIAYKYTNILVTSPHPENLKTLFEFLLSGLDALGYEKASDYESVRSANPDFNKAVIQVNVMRKHRQTVKYVHPSSGSKLGLVELVVIDEAAAIPLPFVKRLLGPYLVFMASTINGYEGTGRSLSLKLISQLREESKTAAALQDGFASQPKRKSSVTNRVLHELTLTESIRYRTGDKVEDWLNRLLCLDVVVAPPSLSNPPNPKDCQLYFINRDILFSYNKLSERFLRQLVAIFVASHYKNSPNDLLIMSDAPAHEIFCLCMQSEKKLPEILCVIQVCLEGKITKETVHQELARGRRRAGDLIPWTISEEYTEDFSSLSGVRIVRIATHPNYQNKGYGLRALEMIEDFYSGKFISFEEKSESLLEELSQKTPEALDYVGVSYGLSNNLLRFWKKAGFTPVYLGYSPNNLTGEHSCIMLKQLADSNNSKWLPTFYNDFCEKVVLALPFPKLPSSLYLELLTSNTLEKICSSSLAKNELNVHLEKSDLKVLTSYCQNPSVLSLPNYIVTVLARFYFTHRAKSIDLNPAEKAAVFIIGLLHASVTEAAKEYNFSSTDQIVQDFNSATRKIGTCIVDISESDMT